MHCPGPLGVGRGGNPRHPVRIRQGLGSRQGDRLVLQTGSGGFDSLGFHWTVVQRSELGSDTLVIAVRFCAVLLASLAKRSTHPPVERTCTGSNPVRRATNRGTGSESDRTRSWYR